MMYSRGVPIRGPYFFAKNEARFEMEEDSKGGKSSGDVEKWGSGDMLLGFAIPLPTEEVSVRQHPFSQPIKSGGGLLQELNRSSEDSLAKPALRKPLSARLGVPF